MILAILSVVPTGLVDSMINKSPSFKFGKLPLSYIAVNLLNRLIYMSTDYVYPGTTGNYKEEDPLLPINDYAWTKLGGECAVQLYNNSLIK